MIRRERVATMDDVKATKLKENKKKNENKYEFTVYADEYKQESNSDCRTNPVAMPVLDWVTLNPLQSQSSLDFFSTTRLSIKECSP